MNTKLKSAFTLVELLVVIAIVGILSGLIIVGMNNSVNNARVARAQMFSASLRDSLLANIVSEWKLDETSGSTAVDSWNTNNCSWNGATGGTNTTPNWRPASECVYNGCLNFDGTDDYLNCGNTSNLNILNGITISAWIKTTATNQVAIIRHKEGVGDGAGYSFFIGSGYVQFRLEGPTDVYDNTIVSDLTINNNLWHHIVGVRRTNPKEMAVYVDTVGKSSTDTTTDINSNTPLYIGGPYYSLYFTGLMDDIRIYNSALSSAQIKEQYYLGLNNIFMKGEMSKIEYESRLNNYYN